MAATNPASPNPHPGSRRPGDAAWVGFVLLMLAHVLCQYGYLIVHSLTVKADTLEQVVSILVPLIWIGLSQLVYALPLAIWLTKTHRLRARKGLLIGVILTIAANLIVYAI